MSSRWFRVRLKGASNEEGLSLACAEERVVMAKPMTETQLILALEKLNERWPKGYWLWAASGTLWLMKCNPDGEQMMLSSGGVDPAGIICSFGGITCDGGDW